MIGDKLADVQAGRAAGCRPVLVRTGYGAEEEASVPAGTPVYDDLPAAVNAIVGGA
jgi:D-glycero-D-manno-heptose 1,7-bisphosphate phosphatase